MRPVLDALSIETHTMTRLDEVEFIVDRSIVQAVATMAPVCFILSPLLTGGKVFCEIRGSGSWHSLLNHPVSRDQAKVMNRFDITKRLVGLLHADEAVIGGIGYTNFDLWAASESAARTAAAELLHAGQHGAGGADRAGRGDCAAGAEGVRAGGRRVGADAAWVAVDGGGAGRRRTCAS